MVCFKKLTERHPRCFFVNFIKILISNKTISKAVTVNRAVYIKVLAEKSLKNSYRCLMFV